MRAVFGVVILGLVLAAYAMLSRPPAAGADDGYFILAVSWTPSWCAREGDARNDDRCARGSGAGWLVHGLWPQNPDGTWPEFCDTPHAAPSRAQTAGMVDIMGSSGLAWHQWRKHGTCSGLNADGYFDATRRAFATFRFPVQATQADRRIEPAGLTGMVQQDNPNIGDDMIFATCHSGKLQELRICLNRDLAPRPCDARTLQRACNAATLTLPALR